MEEKRHSVRVSKSLVVGYQRLLEFLKTSTHSLDISEGGIRLSVCQRMEPGYVLKLWIDLDDAHTLKPIEAVGEVVWLKETNNAKFPFEIGIKFIQISSDDCKKLSEHIRKISGESGESTNNVEWIG